MEARGTLLAAVLLAAALTGCIGGDGANADDRGADAEVADDVQPTTADGTATDPRAPGSPAAGGTDGARDVDLLAEPLTWQVGDWWRYESPQLGTYTQVVTGIEGGDYLVGTDHEQMAFFDARTDVSMLGEVRQSDLAGSQGSTRVQFFDFPLEEGKSWSTTWDDVERTITVVEAADGVARLEAREGDRLAVEYTYDGTVGWFGQITFHAPNGTVNFHGELRNSGAAFDGRVASWTIHTGAGGHSTLMPAAAPIGVSFEVPEGATDIWLSLQVDCPATGVFAFGVSPSEDPFGLQTGEGYGVSEVCPYSANTTGPVVEAPSPGTWEGGILAASPIEQGTVTFEVLVRTLELSAVEA